MPVGQININTLYQWAVNCLYHVIVEDFELVERVPLATSSDFLQSINRENTIEEAAERT